MSDETNPGPPELPAPPRLARTAEWRDKKFVSLEDMQACLANETLLLECAAMIKVAQMKGHPPLLGVAMCIGNFLAEVSGESVAAVAVREAFRQLPPEPPVDPKKN